MAAEKAELDVKSKLEANLQKSNFFLPSTSGAKKSKQETKASTTDELKSTEENAEEKGKSAAKPVKPGQARKINLYLVDPERFVIEWQAPKKLGKPLPLHYDIFVNNHPFTKVVSQSDSKANVDAFRVLVHNCEPDELYKVAIDTYNDAIKGKQSTLYSVKTVLKPSVVTDLSMANGVISWKPPIYRSFGDLSYELIDADDVEEKTILSTKDCQINIDEHYKQQPDANPSELQWRVRIKESRENHCSFSPIIDYNNGEISCAKFTAAKVFEGDLSALPTLKYPKWEPPPKPEILKEINEVKCIDKGSYLLVPSDLNDATGDNVLTCICFSDTHTKHDAYRFDKLPPADIVLHAGDFTFDGNKGEVLAFERWGRFIASLHVDESRNAQLYDDYYNKEQKISDPDDGDDGSDEQKNEAVEEDENKVEIALADRKYKHLVCIAGNHELTFHVDWYNKPNSNAKRYHRLKKVALNAQEIKDIVAKSAHWQYLEDSALSLYGLKIYGSPWQPYFYNWAFQVSRGKELEEKWKVIPKDTDILLTHGPPFCHGDKVNLDRVRQTGDDREYSGDEDLMNRVCEIGSIEYHVFGHVHAGFGASRQNNVSTTFVNAASLNELYAPTHKPIVFHIQKKQ